MKIHKYLIYFFLAGFMICMFSISGYAIEYVTKPPADMDLEDITNKIVKEMNNTFGVKRSRAFTKDDVNFTKSFKYYTYDRVLDLPFNDFKELEQFLDNDDKTIYQIPVYLDGNTWIAGIARGLPVAKSAYGVLSNEEIARLEADVGKWKVHFISYIEGELFNPYKKAAELAGDNKNTPLIVGSINGMTQRAVAIFPDEQGRIGKIVTLEPIGIEIAEQLGIDGTNIDGHIYAVVDFSHAKEVFGNVLLTGDEAVDANDNLSPDASIGLMDGYTSVNEDTIRDSQNNLANGANSTRTIFLVLIFAVAAVVAIIITKRVHARISDKG